MGQYFCHDVFYFLKYHRSDSLQGLGFGALHAAWLLGDLCTLYPPWDTVCRRIDMLRKNAARLYRVH